jgi:acetyl-CoA synthetase (ADP-forming)
MAFLKFFKKKPKKPLKKKPFKPKVIKKRIYKVKPKIRVKKVKKIVKPIIKKIEAKPRMIEVKPKILEKMNDEKAYKILKKYRIPLPEYAFCKNEKELLLSLKRVGFPCVMKVSGNIIHKTEVNGVRLNINSSEEALKTFKELIKIKGCKKVLAQKMITEGYEIIVGGKQDPQFNRIVALGAGGIFTELLKDVSFRVCPLTRSDAEEMLKEVKFSDLILKGFRGQKPADVNSIIEVILAVSRIMENVSDIKELDINPLFATPTKAIATDVRIILE